MKKRWIAMVIILSITALLVGGCTNAYQNKEKPDEIVTPKTFEALPVAEQVKYRPVKVVEEEVAAKVDKGVGIAETGVTIVSPYAEAVPYGNIAIGIIAGLAGGWVKYRPYVTALKETVIGIGDPSTDAGAALAKSQSSTTKRIVKCMKV